MSRIARFSTNLPEAMSGPHGLVAINAGASRGFTLTSIIFGNTYGATELGFLWISRYTGLASGGTAGSVFDFTDGDSAASSVMITPTTFGTNQVAGPQYYPVVNGSAFNAGGASDEAFYFGGVYVADLGEGIYVAPGNSLVFEYYQPIATVVFQENLKP